MMLAQQKAMQTMQEPGAVAQKIESFLRFRAVVDGYRLMAQKAAMAMAPPPPAPGSTPAASDGPPQ